MQSALFAVTIVMLMQESTKVVLHSASAYVKDVTNVRRVAACVLYIASGMLAFYRETGVERALASDSPIPMLVGISDSRISGLYAEVLLIFLTVCNFVLLALACIKNVYRRLWPHCSCGLKCVPPHPPTCRPSAPCFPNKTFI